MGRAVAMVRKNTIRSSAAPAVVAWDSGGNAAVVDNDIAPGPVQSTGGNSGALQRSTRNAAKSIELLDSRELRAHCRSTL